MILKNILQNVVYPFYKSYPDFLIIGAQKAGTTALYRYLIQHPQITPNRTYKEVHFFDKFDNYVQGMGRYLRDFPPRWRKGNRLTLDVTPAYLFNSEVPLRIKKNLGEIKMIVLLREPASRAYSAWSMYHSFANLPLKIHDADPRNFSEAITQEFDPSSYPQTNHHCFNYIKRGIYYQQIFNYYQYFAKENILIFDSQELRKNLAFVLNQICDFLEVERFSQGQLDILQTQQHHRGKYIKSDQDLATLAQLRDYFQPHNQMLFQLLGKTYDW
jgi:hypothetical protein